MSFISVVPVTDITPDKSFSLVNAFLAEILISEPIHDPVILSVDISCLEIDANPFMFCIFGFNPSISRFTSVSLKFVV